MRAKAIALVEAAYDLESNEKAWLESLLRNAGSDLDRGMGVLAWRYVLGKDFRVGEIARSAVESPALRTV